MLVTVDVGNTNICFGVFDDGILIRRWRTTSVSRVSVSFLYRQIQKNMYAIGGHISSFCIGSVVPWITDVFRKLKEKYPGIPFLIAGDEGVEWGIKTHVKASVIGSDILLNGLAGFHTYKTALIVVDLGTATTFDIFDDEGSYVGSVFAPGVLLSLKALYQSAALLPKIRIAYRRSVVGTDTQSCMQSGIFWGHFLMIEAMIRKIKSQLKYRPLVIGTGGLSHFFARGGRNTAKEDFLFDHVDTDLTLKGLYILATQNSSTR